MRSIVDTSAFIGVEQARLDGEPLRPTAPYRWSPSASGSSVAWLPLVTRDRDYGGVPGLAVIAL